MILNNFPHVTVQGGGEEIGTGPILVRFIDYDGTVIKQKRIESGESVTPPDDPSHDNLSFDGWNHNSTELSSVTQDLDVGAMYTTTDGKTRLSILLTTLSGLSPTLYFVKSDTSTLTIDWGDESTDTNLTYSGAVNASHTYAAAGFYTIKVWISSGSGTYTLGVLNYTCVGGNTDYKNILLEANIGDDVEAITSYSFQYNRNLEYLSIPSVVTAMDGNCFYECNSLRAVIIPRGNTALYYQQFFDCYCIQAVSIPSTVAGCSSYVFRYCYSLQRLIFPDGLSGGIYIYAFYGCRTLYDLHLPAVLDDIEEYLFRDCYALQSIRVPSTVAAVAARAFNNCGNLREYIFEPTTPPTLVNVNAFDSLTNVDKIYVPDISVAAYKAATNWSTYADYIYPLSDIE